MPTYSAFLRAINVGKRRVAMADLRRHFEAMGFVSDAFVRSAAELEAILARRPFGAIPDGVAEHIAFLKAQATASSAGPPASGNTRECAICRVLLGDRGAVLVSLGERGGRARGARLPVATSRRTTPCARPFPS